MRVDGLQLYAINSILAKPVVCKRLLHLEYLSVNCNFYLVLLFSIFRDNVVQERVSASFGLFLLGCSSV